MGDRRYLVIDDHRVLDEHADRRFLRADAGPGGEQCFPADHGRHLSDRTPPYICIDARPGQTHRAIHYVLSWVHISTDENSYLPPCCHHLNRELTMDGSFPRLCADSRKLRRDQSRRAGSTLVVGWQLLTRSSCCAPGAPRQSSPTNREIAARWRSIHKSSREWTRICLGVPVGYRSAC